MKKITKNQATEVASSHHFNSLSKILLATSQINFMATNLYTTGMQWDIIYSFNKETHPVHEQGREERNELLSEIVQKLTGIMDDLGEYCNGVDCMSAIDERIAKVPFEILVHNMDDIEEYYEEEDLNTRL